MPVIFVMEDAGALPSPLIRRLVGEGYHTVSLRNAEETLSTLRCVRPHLLIIDATHGKTGGDVAGVIESVRQDPTYGTLPVLLIGAGAAACRDLKRSLCAGGGADPFLDATWSPDVVVDRVRACVEPMSVPYN